MLAFRATRGGLRLLSPHAPDLAAKWAERLFLTARRHERPSWERARLEAATAGRIPYGEGFLPTWTWTPAGFSAQGKTVVLVHGWEGRGSQLANFVEPLVERGFRVVTFDAPGHGDSPLALGSVVDHARSVRTVVDAIGPVHAVIGHSVGGAAALLASRSGHLADRFALVCPPATPARFAATFAREFRLDEAVRQAMIARVEARYDVRLAELDAREDAERLEAPLLVVHDHDDRVVAFEEGSSLATIAPRGELLATRGLGHRAVLRAPEVVTAITRFIAGDAASFAESLDGYLFERDRRWARRRLDV